MMEGVSASYSCVKLVTQTWSYFTVMLLVVLLAIVLVAGGVCILMCVCGCWWCVSGVCGWLVVRAWCVGLVLPNRSTCTNWLNRSVVLYTQKSICRLRQVDDFFDVGRSDVTQCWSKQSEKAGCYSDDVIRRLHGSLSEQYAQPTWCSDHNTIAWFCMDPVFIN